MADKRKVITVAVCFVGLAFALAGETGLAFVIDAGALAWFWVFRPRAAPPPPSLPDTVQVSAGNMIGSDGIRGAFERLDPAWQRWLSGQGRAD